MGKSARFPEVDLHPENMWRMTFNASLYNETHDFVLAISRLYVPSANILEFDIKEDDHAKLAKFLGHQQPLPFIKRNSESKSFSRMKVLPLRTFSFVLMLLVSIGVNWIISMAILRACTDSCMIAYQRVASCYPVLGHQQPLPFIK